MSFEEERKNQSGVRFGWDYLHDLLFQLFQLFHLSLSPLFNALTANALNVNVFTIVVCWLKVKRFRGDR